MLDLDNLAGRAVDAARWWSLSELHDIVCIDVPALIAEVRRLRAELERRPLVVCHDGYAFCATCGTVLGIEE